MIIHKTHRLELSGSQTQTLNTLYLDLIKTLEEGCRPDPGIMENLKAALSQVVKESKPWQELLREVSLCNESYCLHLLHPDNHILNLPWSMALDPVSGLTLDPVSGLTLDPVSGLTMNQHPRLYLTRGIPAGFNPGAAVTPSAPAPLKVLVMISAPVDAPAKDRLSYEKEELEILKAFQPLMQSRLVQVDFTEDGSLDALARKLKENRFHILHVSGHGGFQKESGKGFLQLEDPVTLKAVWVEAGEFAETVNSNPRHPVPMVVLSSCQTAQGGMERGLGGVTDCLMQEGVPAVVSMGMSISDHYAAMFTAALYRRMAHKEPVFKAFHGAVQELKEMEYRDLVEAGVQPALPMQWIIPNLYLSGHLDAVVEWKESEEKMTFSANRVIFDKNRLLLPHERDYLFIGRKQEKAKILRPFFNRVPILLTGQGGVGKTAMAEHLLQRLTAREPKTELFLFDEKNCSAKVILDTMQDFLKGFLNKKGEQLSEGELIDLETPIEKFEYLAAKIAEIAEPVFVLDNLESFQVEQGGAFVDSFLHVKEFIDYLCDRAFGKFHVILTCRYPVPDVANLAAFDMNQVGLVDFWKRANYLDVGHLNTLLFEAEEEQARQGLPPAKTMTFMDIVQLLHQTFGGNYRALEFFNQLVREEPGKIVDSLESMESFRERLKGFTGEVRRRMGRDLLFSLLMGLLEPSRQGVLETLSHFRVPVVIKALEMQGRKGGKDGEGVDLEEMLDGLGRLTLIEVTADRGSGSFYYYVTPLVRDLLGVYNEEQKRSVSPFSHQQAGEYFYDIFHNIEKSAAPLEEAFYHFAESGDKEKVAEIGDRLSRFYYKNSMYHNAFFYAHGVYRLLGDETKSVILNRLGIIYKIYGKNDLALSFLEKALADCRKIGDKSGEGTTLNNISGIYRVRGDYETALKYLEQSLTIRREIGDKSGEAYTLFYMGLTYIQNINRPEEGMACLKTVLAINEKLKDARLTEALKGYEGILKS